MGDTLDRLAKNGYEVYHVSANLAFALNEQNVLFMCPFASYLVTASQLNSKAGQDRIRRGISSGQYKDISDVLTDMKLIAGVGVSYKMVNARSFYD